MIGPTWKRRRARLAVAGAAAALMLVGAASLAPQARAGVFVSVGVPFPGAYYGPGPYYGYAPPPPYYYPPPAYAYYPPAPQGYYPPNPPGLSAYSPATPPEAGASAAPSAGSGLPKITYTSKPAFTNSAGQTCREYKTTDTSGGRPVAVFGTACKQADGQWRVVN